MCVVSVVEHLFSLVRDAVVLEEVGGEFVELLEDLVDFNVLLLLNRGGGQLQGLRDYGRSRGLDELLEGFLHPLLLLLNLNDLIGILPPLLFENSLQLVYLLLIIHYLLGQSPDSPR